MPFTATLALALHVRMGAHGYRQPTSNHLPFSLSGEASKELRFPRGGALGLESILNCNNGRKDYLLAFWGCGCFPLLCHGAIKFRHQPALKIPPSQVDEKAG